MKTFLVSLRIFIVLTVLTGILYPLMVYELGRVFFPSEIAGSLIEKDGKVLGSKLIAQAFVGEKYFHPRPSAANYATVPSGASNLSPTSLAFKEAVEKRRAQLGAKAPDDLLTSSASGLDPDISIEAALFQVERIAKARNFDETQKQKLRDLIMGAATEPQFGFLGTRRVNVLALNLLFGDT